MIAAGVTRPLVALFSNEMAGFVSVAAFYAVIFILISVVVFWGTPGRDRSVATTWKENILSQYLAAFKNRAFLLIAVEYVFHSFVVTVISSSLIFYTKYYIRYEDSISPIFLVLLLTAMVSIPLWLWISKKLDKKAAYVDGLAIMRVDMLVIFFLRSDQVSWLYGLAGLAGLGLPTLFIMPWAMIPDTIEYHEL